MRLNQIVNNAVVPEDVLKKIERIQRLERLKQKLLDEIKQPLEIVGKGLSEKLENALVNQQNEYRGKLVDNLYRVEKVNVYASNFGEGLTKLRFAIHSLRADNRRLGNAFSPEQLILVKEDK
jgi:uncharacterized protein (UPF0335 family)